MASPLLSLGLKTPAGGDGAAPEPATIISVSDAAHAPSLAQAGAWFRCTNGGGCAVSIPTNATVAFPVGTMLTYEQAAAGALTFGGSGVTINVAATHLKATVDQHAVVQLVKVATDTWTIFGNLEAA